MKRGFTLAELLVALLLTAIAIGVMSEGVRRTIDFQQRLETARIERESRSALLSALASRLERLVPAMAPAAVEGADATILFEGNERLLAFLAADPAYPSRPGLYEYRLEILAPDAEDGSAEPSVLRLSRRGLTVLEQFGTTAGTPFRSWDLPMTGQLTFRYGDQASNLQPVWQDTNVYPAFIALQAADANTPATIIALPGAAPVSEPEDGETTTQ